MVVGTVEGVVNAKVPGTLAAPPESTEEARVCPSRIGLAVGGVVIVGAPLAMVKERVPFPVPLPLVALTSVLKVPAAVGVPVMAPVLLSRVRPAGNAVELPKDVGFSVAVMFAVNGRPTVPERLALVTSGTPGVAAVTLPVTGTRTSVAPVLERVILPDGVPTGAEAARRTKSVALAFPAVWGIVVVFPKPEVEFVEISKLAGAVAVMFAVRLEPDAMKDCVAEAVPLMVVKGERVPLVVMLGVVGAAEVDPLAVAGDIVL